MIIKINASDLAGLFAWIVDAQEFVPLTDEAKEVIEQLISWQSRQKEIATPTIAYLMPAKHMSGSAQVDAIDAAFAKLGQIESSYMRHFGAMPPITDQQEDL